MPTTPTVPETAPAPHLESTSSNVLGQFVYEVGHAKGDRLHMYLRLWKVKPEIIEGTRDPWGNDHLRGELVCNIAITHDESEDMARAFHAAQGALVYEINRAADKELPPPEARRCTPSPGGLGMARTVHAIKVGVQPSPPRKDPITLRLLNEFQSEEEDFWVVDIRPAEKGDLIADLGETCVMGAGNAQRDLCVIVMRTKPRGT